MGKLSLTNEEGAESVEVDDAAGVIIREAMNSSRIGMAAPKLQSGPAVCDECAMALHYEAQREMAAHREAQRAKAASRAEV